MRSTFNIKDSEERRRMAFLKQMELNEILFYDINESAKQNSSQLTEEEKGKLEKITYFFDETSKIIETMKLLDGKSDEDRINFLNIALNEMTIFVKKITNEKLLFIKTTNMIRLRDAFFYYLFDPMKDESLTAEVQQKLTEWDKVLDGGSQGSDKKLVTKKMTSIIDEEEELDTPYEDVPRLSQHKSASFAVKRVPIEKEKQTPELIDQSNAPDAIRKRNTWQQHVKAQSSGNGVEYRNVIQEFRRQQSLTRPPFTSTTSHSEEEKDSLEKKYKN